MGQPENPVMPETVSHNPKSTAKIGGHPIHPMIIPFPIAFFVSALVTDLLSLTTGGEGFARASAWLLGAGIVTALLAAVFGFTDFLGEARVRALRQAWLHMGGNLLAVVLEAVNLYVRTLGGARTVTDADAALSAFVVVLLLFNGWMGWEMVYRGHVGVSDEPLTPEPAPQRGRWDSHGRPAHNA
jgi:uncharacterized membrane protein